MRKIILLLFSSISFVFYAATPGNVDLLNTGKMYIASSPTGNSASMYVVNAVRCTLDANIILDGVWKIGGNFIQDSETNVFETDENGYTTSDGTIVFTSQVDGSTVRRYITATDFADYDRSEHYIAFPHIRIDTNDTLVAPCKMGIDALSVQRSSETDKNGFLLLESGVTANGAVYDASLRITDEGGSEELVTPGLIVVEQYMGAYRNGNDPQLFPFASPFKDTQKSGYFAGNWIRRLLCDDMRHTTYVLGNKPSTNDPNVISRDQYIIDPMETFVAGAPYLIKPREADFDYSKLQENGGLAVTGAEASLYDQEKFTFNGKVYNITSYDEQLFADDTLFSYTFKESVTLPNTVNWVIGNSYTAPLSINAIAEIMGTSPLTFLPYIYVYPPGASGYQAVSLLDDGFGSEHDEIPSKSIFMIRLAGGSAVAANATFTIGKQQQIQGNVSHNLKAAAISTDRDVSFRVTPEQNTSVYDFSTVGLRAAASFGNDAYDIPKIYDPAKQGFQLFTKTVSNGSRLSANGIPWETDSVLLGFKSQPEEMRYTLTVSQKNEGELWLKDLNTNVITDLQQTSSYSFTGKGSDPEDRFVVYFTNPLRSAITTSISSAGSSDISVCFPDNRLSVFGLIKADINSNLFIYDVQGRTVFSGTISRYPQQDFNINLPKHVYMISIQGQRNFNCKVIK